MEKDRFRSVITVGMLACSILILSALFIGCEKHRTQQKLLSAAQLGCPHLVKAAYYTHPIVLPHDTTKAVFTWVVLLPPSSTTSAPAAQKCPVDPAMTNADYVKCTVCGAQLWP
jgi:hypothetical protein